MRPPRLLSHLGRLVLGASLLLGANSPAWAQTRVALEVAPSSVAEGDVATTITVTATLDAAAAQDLLVQVTVGAADATALAGDDYTVNRSSFNIAIAAGATAGAGEFVLTPFRDNNENEGDETVGVAAAAAGLTTVGAAVTITDEPELRVSVDFSHDSIAEGDGPTTVTATATLPSGALSANAVPFQVEVSLYAGGLLSGRGRARRNSDYAIDRLRTLITIGPGEAEGAAAFVLTPFRDNNENEGAEDVFFQVRGQSLFQSVRIIDRDRIPVALSATPDAVTEGDEPATITVTAALENALPAGAAPVVVSVTAGGGTATAGADYAVDRDRFDVTIRPGNAAGIGKFSLTPLADDATESDETVRLSASGPGLSITSAQLVIADEGSAQAPPAPTRVALNVSPYQAAEGYIAAVTVRADLDAAAREELVVPITVGGGTATMGADADYSVDRDRFNIIIGKGETSGRGAFTVTALRDDDEDEGDETVNITAAAPAGLAAVNTELIITDQARLHVHLYTDRSAVAEGDDPAAVTVTAVLWRRLSNPELGTSLYQIPLPADAVPVTVAVSMESTAAIPGDDYTVQPSRPRVTILPGADTGTSTFVLTAIDDESNEGNEFLELHVVSRGIWDHQQPVITITDEGSMPTGIGLEVNPARATEGAAAEIAVTAFLAPRGLTRDSDTTVAVAVTDGTAAAGAGRDYAVDRDRFTITIPAGASSATDSFTLTAAADGETEGEETVVVSGAANDLPVGVATVAVLDRSPVALAVAPARLVEGNAATLEVTAALRDGAPRPVDTLVAVTVEDGSAAAGADYTTDRNRFTITIPAGAANAASAFTLNALADNRNESDETVRLLAALGRSAAVVDETEVVIQDLPAAERLREVNETILPELARALSAGARNAVTECLDEALEGSGKMRLGGQSSAAGLVLSGARALAGESDASWRRALGGTSLALSMGGGGEDEEPRAAGVTLCAGGEYRDLKDESGRNPVDWAGFVRSVHGGGNIALSDNLLAGVALSWFDGRFDYADGRGRGLESRHKTEMFGIHPYMGWSWTEHARVWAMAGYGWGETTLEDFSAGSLLRTKSDISMLSGAAGGSLRLAQQEGHRAAFDLKAETWTTRLELDGSEHLEKMDIEITGARLALEGSYELSLAREGRLRPELEIGARYDGGDGATGFGLETLAGLHYAQGRRHAVLRGRTLLAHEADIHDWGVHGSLALDSGAGGLGWSAGLGTDYGAAGGNAAQLWNDGMGGATAEREAASGLRARAEAGYGIGLWRGLLTPYGALDLGQGGGRAWSLGARARFGAGWFLHFKGERREYADSTADHRLWLDLAAPLAADPPR